MDVRGKNGWFKVSTIKVFRSAHSGKVYVNIRSKFPSRTPPSIIEGTEEELLDFCRKVFDGIGGFKAAVIKAAIPKQHQQKDPH